MNRSEVPITYYTGYYTILSKVNIQIKQCDNTNTKMHKKRKIELLSIAEMNSDREMLKA